MKLLFQTDNTVNYRGFFIDYIEDLFPESPKGDLDLSGVYNVTDIVTMINVILGLDVNFQDNIICRSDLNNDEIVNVVDIVSLVDLILNNWK